MASPSKHSAFMTALQAWLAGITAGATYWYTPKVIRAVAMEERFLDSTINESALYILVPSEDVPGLQTFGTIGSQLGVDALLCTPFTSGDDPFNPPSPDRWEVQDRLRQDFMGRMELNPKMTGTCINVQPSALEQSPEDTYHPTWAIVFVHLVASLEWVEGQP